MRSVKLLAVMFLLMLFTLSAGIASPANAADPPGPPPENPACSKITNFEFPPLTVNAAKGPRFIQIQYQVDADCHLVEKARRVLMNVPEDYIQQATNFSVSMSEGSGDPSATDPDSTDTFGTLRAYPKNW